MYTVTTDNTRIIQSSTQNHWSGIIDKVSVVYDYLFGSDDSIIEKNKYVILFVQHTVQNGDFKTINRFLSDSSISELDISILYSISIIINQFNELDFQLVRLKKLIESKV